MRAVSREHGHHEPIPPIIQKLNASNETIWTCIGRVAENMNDMDKALYAYENSLHYNHFNVKALTAIAGMYRNKDQYSKAVEYYHRALNVENNNSEIWGALGHCFLMMDELQKAYSAYHQAIYNAKLQNKSKDPHLWYGIGILYERYTSLDNAEEAFTSVLKMSPGFEKSNEIHFRLGIIYKQQNKYDQSLECFGHILQNPPHPLTEADIWFQIGHVYELKKDFVEAKKSYEKVLKYNSNHAKVLQQLGWLYHQNTQFGDQDIAITYLQRSIDADPADGQTWYLLGRCFMAQQKYRSAYDAYQQAVFRDGRNPTFWCSIGVLYYQINQFKDALDAYSRAIRLNPYLSEVWYDLGTLYESCNQLYDALDAYQRAADLDPKNKHIHQRLNMLRSQVSNKQTHMGEKTDSKGALAPINTVDATPNSRFAQQTPPPPVPIQPKSSVIAPPNFSELTRQHQGGGSGPAPGSMNGPPPQMGGGMPPNMGGAPQGGNQLPSLSSNAPNPNATLSAVGSGGPQPSHHGASPMHPYNPPRDQMRPDPMREQIRPDPMRGGMPPMSGAPPQMGGAPPTITNPRSSNVSPFAQQTQQLQAPQPQPQRYNGTPTGNYPNQLPPQNQPYANNYPHHEQIPPMVDTSIKDNPERDLKRPSPQMSGGAYQSIEQDRKRPKFSHYGSQDQPPTQTRPQKRAEDDDDDDDEDEMVIHDEMEERNKRREPTRNEENRNGKQEPPSVAITNKDENNSPKSGTSNGENKE